MDVARAMALGGKPVYAKDCNFSSYLELGLCCTVCKEPVCLKSGKIRKPHFAHFNGTNPKQVEKCKLRVSVYGNDTENINYIDDRGQRLEIFQKNFLNMIFIEGNKIVDDSNFKNWIHSITQTYNQAINNITKDCRKYFLMNRESMQDKYILPRTEIKDKQILLNQEIALEAMNYLCVKSSVSLLDYILHYSIYKFHKQSQKYDFFKQLSQEENQNKICLFVTEIIILNPWIKAFCSVGITNSLTVNNFQLSSSEQTQQKVPSLLQRFLGQVQKHVDGKPINSLNINAYQLSNHERNLLIDPLPLHYTFAALRYNVRGGKKLTNISCKVVISSNHDENIAIQFSFFVNDYIKVDSPYKNANGRYIKVDSEIWHPALVYKFSPNFNLSVEQHNEMLFPYGGYVHEFPNLKTRCELANVFIELIRADKIQYILTKEYDKLYIVSASDCNVLLLCELLEHCHEYKEIELKTFIQCIINAAEKAVNSGVPLIKGMLLHSLYTAAKAQAL